MIKLPLDEFYMILEYKNILRTVKKGTNLQKLMLIYFPTFKSKRKYYLNSCRNSTSSHEKNKATKQNKTKKPPENKKSFAN